MTLSGTGLPQSSEDRQVKNPSLPGHLGGPWGPSAAQDRERTCKVLRLRGRVWSGDTSRIGGARTSEFLVSGEVGSQAPPSAFLRTSSQSHEAEMASHTSGSMFLQLPLRL